MGATDDREMLEVAKEECGRLERDLAQADRSFRATYTANGKLNSKVIDLKAERDAALAVRDELVMLIRTSPAEWSTSEGVDIIVRGVEEREMNEILTTSPAQSLANLQAALVLEYIDGPEHAESLREAKASVFHGLAQYFGQSGGTMSWKDSVLMQMMTEQAAEYRKAETEGK